MTDPVHLGDNVTLYLADCLDVMREMPTSSVDAVVTDPPYGVGRDKGFEGFEGFGGFGKPIARTRYRGDWDSRRPEKPYFDEVLRVSRRDRRIYCPGSGCRVAAY